jgi:hypothetical protein
MANVTIGLLGVDAVIAARVLVSHLGHTGKEIGLAIVAAVAIADLAFLQYLRRRQPELTRKSTTGE